MRVPDLEAVVSDYEPIMHPNFDTVTGYFDCHVCSGGITPMDVFTRCPVCDHYFRFHEQCAGKARRLVPYEDTRS